jgi:hypothetical protein
LRAELVRFLDRAPVVIAPVLRREETAAAQAGDNEVVFSDGFLGLR